MYHEISPGDLLYDAQGLSLLLYEYIAITHVNYDMIIRS